MTNLERAVDVFLAKWAAAGVRVERRLDTEEQIHLLGLELGRMGLEVFDLAQVARMERIAKSKGVKG